MPRLKSATVIIMAITLFCLYWGQLNTARAAKVSPSVQIESIRNDLMNEGITEDRLDFCAELIYAIRNVNDYSFIESSVFVFPEKKILGNFLTENEVIDYGKIGQTGEQWDVVYFRDKGGNETDIPAIAYVAEKQQKNAVKNIEQAISYWTETVPDFLAIMVKNNVRCLFQAVSSNMNDGNGSGLFKYDPEVIYWDKGIPVNEVAFLAGWRRAFGVEQFGTRLEFLGIYDWIDIAVLKQALATACCDNLAIKTGDELAVNFAKSYRSTLEQYMEGYSCSQEHLNELIYDIVSHPGYVIPYGADDWRDVNSDIITNAIEWNEITTARIDVLWDCSLV